MDLHFRWNRFLTCWSSTCKKHVEESFSFDENNKPFTLTQRRVLTLLKKGFWKRKQSKILFVYFIYCSICVNGAECQHNPIYFTLSNSFPTLTNPSNLWFLSTNMAAIFDSHGDTEQDPLKTFRNWLAKVFSSFQGQFSNHFFLFMYFGYLHLMLNNSTLSVRNGVWKALL